MARNRQRAKERQAERRAARQAARENSGSTSPVPGVVPEQGGLNAPPEELGMSAYSLEHTSESEEFIGDLQTGDEPYDGDDDNGAAAEVAGPRGVRGGREHEDEHHHHARGRVTGFLVAVWAEL